MSFKIERCSTKSIYLWSQPLTIVSPVVLVSPHLTKSNCLFKPMVKSLFDPSSREQSTYNTRHSALHIIAGPYQCLCCFISVSVTGLFYVPLNWRYICPLECWQLPLRPAALPESEKVAQMYPHPLRADLFCWLLFHCRTLIPPTVPTTATLITSSGLWSTCLLRWENLRVFARIRNSRVCPLRTV